MNINTERVKVKTFDKIIDSETAKKSEEYKVLAVLRYCYPEIYDNTVVEETPDLQDSVKNYGIEVTDAVDPNDMKATRAFAELCEDNNPDKQKKKIANTGYLLTEDTEIRSISKGGGGSHKRFIQESIKRKSKKLPSYSEKFVSIGLAINFPEIPTREDEEKCVDWGKEVLQPTSETAFDKLFFISHRFCITYLVKENKVQRINLSADENRCLSVIARMTAEGEITLGAKEWN